MILWSHQSTGVVTKHGAADQFVLSPLMAEALAIKAALSHALELGISSLCLRSDAQDLVRAISSREYIKELFGILFYIHSLASNFSSLAFVFVPRLSNVAVDDLAKLCGANFSYLLRVPPFRRVPTGLRSLSLPDVDL
ncbi:hypothetical protein V5N11_007392 [Cardamine amara subsp. amara]|uniref:RNase H type-1 domain-containing protein n=1 Tax=Cardamine amara subsp. amara TaxID=228776 RepID=A0ABD1B4Z0_CARAN